MKKITLLSLVALSVAVVGAEQASAAEMPTKQESKTTIKIDNNGEDGKTNPGVTEPHLQLVSVPEKYDFTSKLVSDGNYNLTAAITADPVANTDAVAVFNDNKAQEWAVRVTMGDASKKGKELSDGTNDYAVSEFNITDDSGKTVNALATGDANILKKSGTKDSTNTGTMYTKVTNVGVKFTDPNKKLTTSSELTGEIVYTLYSTDAAN